MNEAVKKEEKIEAIKSRARKNFSLGYNCAECVTEAVLTVIDTGLPPETRKVATGFGGGVGLYGDTCGAITGAVIAVGCVHGRDQLPQDSDPKQAVKKSADELYGRPGLYRLFDQIPNKFFEKYGYTACRDLTTKWRGNWPCRDHALYCREIITDAAAIAAELIMTDREEAASKPFGKNVEKLEQSGEACNLLDKGT